jgi:adenylosuccinate synthase
MENILKTPLLKIEITKLDVLTGIKELKVATHYELDGVKLNGSMPATI